MANHAFTTNSHKSVDHINELMMIAENLKLVADDGASPIQAVARWMSEKIFEITDDLEENYEIIRSCASPSIGKAA